MVLRPTQGDENPFAHSFRESEGASLHRKCPKAPRLGNGLITDHCFADNYLPPAHNHSMNKAKRRVQFLITDH